MTTYTWPTGNNPAEARYTLRSMGRITQSPFTGAVETASRSSDHWVLTLNWGIIGGDKRADVLGNLARLHGPEHRIEFPIFNYTRRGAGGGTPAVNGAGQTGYSLDIDGGPTSQTNWLRFGDYISFQTAGRPKQLCMVTGDVDTDVSGTASIPINPPVRYAPADAVSVEIDDPVGTFILRNVLDWSERTIFADASMGNAAELEATFVEATAA